MSKTTEFDINLRESISSRQNSTQICEDRYQVDRIRHQSARIDTVSIEFDTRSLSTQQFKEWKVVVSSNGKEKK